MDTESVTLKLPRALLSEAQHVATAREVTIGHMVRQLLRREVDRQLGAKVDQNTDERLVVALQALLARDMADADGWEDLAARLRPHGYDLRMSEVMLFWRNPAATQRYAMRLTSAFPMHRWSNGLTHPFPSMADPTRILVLCRRAGLTQPARLFWLRT